MHRMDINCSNWRPAPNTPCVLMFSGGRDSTLAALRLSAAGFAPILVTVSSGHLYGIEAVRKRLGELKRLLPSNVEWIHVRQPTDLLGRLRFTSRTCLPCQHAYVVVAAAIAQKYGAKYLAMGYASYQGGWPEQTPPATKLLKAALGEANLSLALPCYDLTTKQAAIDLLTKHGIANTSLEQKCLQQVNNVTLDEVTLGAELEIWGAALRQSLHNLVSVKLELIEKNTLGGI